MPRGKAAEQSPEFDDPVGELRRLCEAHNLLTADAGLVRMVNGLLGCNLKSVKDVTPQHLREVRGYVGASAGLFGKIMNEKGREWFLKKKESE